MTSDAREIKRKLRILKHAEETGNVAKTWRYFGIPRSLFYVWRNAYRACGQAGLVRTKPLAKSHPNQTPDAIVEKTLHSYSDTTDGPPNGGQKRDRVITAVAT